MVTGNAPSAQTMLITIVPTLWAGMLRGQPANICLDGCRILQHCYALLGIHSAGPCGAGDEASGRDDERGDVLGGLAGDVGKYR